MIKLLKPLSFIPALLLMYMIYSFSAQDGVTSAKLSYKVSYKMVELGGELLGADFQDWEIDQLANRFQTPVRKLAHMTEYFALAVAVAFPLYVYGLRGILLLLFAGLICVGFACGDEYHQAHVAGRGPSKRDVLIDSFGVFWGIILVRIIGWTGRRTIFHPFSRKNRRDSDTRPEEYPQDTGRFRQPVREAYVQPDQRYPQQPTRETYAQPGQRYPQKPTREAYAQPGQRYPQQPTRETYTQPGQRYPQQPTRETYTQLGQQYPQQPTRQTYSRAGQRYPQQSAQEYYGQPGQRYPQQPVRSSAAQGDYEPDDYDDEYTSSDRLSEDMSFRKLVSDLKEQKQTHRNAHSTGSAQTKG